MAVVVVLVDEVALRVGAVDVNGPISADALPLSDELRERTGEVVVLVVAVLVLLSLFGFDGFFSVDRGKYRVGLVCDEVCDSL